MQRLKWQTRKLRARLKAGWATVRDKFRLWDSSLRRVESRCGAGVAELFLFVKLLIVLNAVSAAAVVALLVLPTVYRAESRGGNGHHASAAEQLWTECETSDESASIECCSAIYENGTRTAGWSAARFSVRGAMDAVRGAGWLEATPMYYGYYPADAATFAVAGRRFEYRVPLAYAATAVGCSVLLFLIVVRKSVAGFRQRVVETQTRYYLYANAVFAGWDCCVSDRASAALRQKAIHDELRSYLAADRPEHGGGGGGRLRANAAVLAVRLLVWSLTAALTGAACYSVHLVFRRSVGLLQQQQRGEQQQQQRTYARSFLLEFAPPVAVTFYNVALPIVFDALSKLERRRPRRRWPAARQDARARAVRIACVKASLLAALLGSVYRLVGCAREKSQCASALCGTPLCWETYAGQTMYRLLAVDVACNIGVTVLISCPRSVLARRVHSDGVLGAVCRQEQNLAKHVLDAVYVQAVVWLGGFYAPPMPALGLVALTVVFYTKRFSCAVNRGLAHRVYSPSRARTAALSALLVTWLLCAAAWLTAAVNVVPSRSCGPFKGLPSAWSALVAYAASVAPPPPVTAACRTLASAHFAFPAAFALLCLVCYYRVAVRSHRNMVAVLRKQLVLEGHDKQFLLNRLSAFIKQQDRRRKAAEDVAGGDPDGPLS